NLCNDVRNNIHPWKYSGKCKAECYCGIDVGVRKLADGVNTERYGKAPAECNDDPAGPVCKCPFQIDVCNNAGTEQYEYCGTYKFCNVSIHNLFPPLDLLIGIKKVHTYSRIL